jgi:4-amino-4-deoxy-L-arabinose transferase-like glycosyltransferase
MKPGSSGSIDVPRLALLLVILLAFGLRLYHLDYQSLWRDEVDALLFARQGLAQLLPLFSTPGHNGPLYYVMLHFWVRLVGDTEFSLRFVSLFCGVLAVPVVYLLGRRWVGRVGSLVAALLCATSPYLVWYSQEGKMYALLFLISVLSTYIYILALERNRVYLWVPYVLLVAASMYVHLLAVLVLPFHFLLFFVAWPRYRAAWRGWLATFVFLTLPYLPLVRWEVALLNRPFTTGHQFYWLHEILAILLFAFGLNAAPHQNLLAISLFIFLLLAGLLLYVRQTPLDSGVSLREVWLNRRNSIILGLYLFVPIVCLFLISLGMPIFTDRYLITVVPAFLLLLSTGVMAVRERAALLAAVCLGLVLLSNLYVIVLQTNTSIKSDFRSAARFVAGDGRGDLMVFLIPHGRPVFDYYYEDEFRWADAPYTNRGLGPRGLAREMETATSGHRQVWLIVTEPELWDSRGLVEEWFAANATLQAQGDFARVKVLLHALAPVDDGVMGVPLQEVREVRPAGAVQACRHGEVRVSPSRAL